MRHRNFEQLFSLYHRYIRLIKLSKYDDIQISEVHTELLAQSKLALVIFGNSQVYKSWQEIHQRLANITEKLKKDSSYKYKKEIEIVFDIASELLTMMGNELK